MPHQHCTLHGLRGGGATDPWLQHRDLPLLRRRGRWTSESTFERYIQEGTFILFFCKKTGSSRKLRTVCVLADLVPLQSKTKESPATSPYRHHVATERAEESVPTCAAASSNRALPTPSRLLEHILHLLVKWDETTEYTQTAHTIQVRTHWDGGRALELQNLSTFFSNCLKLCKASSELCVFLIFKTLFFF